MKKLILLITLILFTIHLMSQKNCVDVVHPTEYQKSILNCCIQDIKPGNIVVYTKEGITSEIQAIAINLNGKYFELNEYDESIRNRVLLNSNPEKLEQGIDYTYHQKMYKRATGQQALGGTLAVLGGCLSLAGTIVMANNFNEFVDDYNDTGNGVGSVLFLSGAACIGVGIPVAITGRNKKKKHKRAMQEIESQLTISIRATNLGVGLVLYF